MRRLFVSVLLVLLPVQAMAAVTICPHSRFATSESGPATASMTEHCLQNQAGDTGKNPDNTGKPQQGDQTPGSCCASVTACAMCGIAANNPQPPAFKSASRIPLCFLSAQFTSFIPEGIQRPPSILA